MAVILVHGGLTIGKRWTFGATLDVPTISMSVCPGFAFSTPYTAVSGRVADPMYKNPVSGSSAPPSQSTPPEPGNVKVPFVPFAASTTDGGVYIGPSRYPLTASRAICLSWGVKSMRSLSLIPCLSTAAGLLGNGCVAAVFSPGASDCGTGRSSIGQTGWPLVRSNTKANDCFVNCTTAL